MPTVISLLRGINVGGHKKIKMADLKALYGSLGLRQVRTVLQSGNVVFEADEGELAGLSGRLEAAIREGFGFDVQVITRTREAFEGAIERQPFDSAQLEEPGKVAVVFLSAVPEPGLVAGLRERNVGREVIFDGGRELYIFYSDGMARSKLDNKRIEGALKVGSTARNWNTCGRLLKLLEAYGD